MRTVYAIQFEISSNKGQSINECLDSLKNRIIAWIKGKYNNSYRQIDFVINFDGKPINITDGNELIINQYSREKLNLITFNLSENNNYDNSLVWQTLCTIAATDKSIELAVIIRISSNYFVLSPLKYKLGRPRIVAEVIKNYKCNISGSLITVAKTEIDVLKFENFTQNELLNPKRVMPIFVVSPDIWTDKSLIDADKLQNQLVGFAKVVLLSKWAAFRLTNRLGKSLSCYNGAIRLYWPGFTDKSNPWEHPLYLAEKIKYYEENGSPFEEHIFRLLSGISAFRFAEGKITRKVRANLEADRLKQTHKLRQEVQEHTATIEQLYPALEQAWDENTQLKQRISELERLVESYQTNLADLWKSQYTEELEGAAQELQEELEFRTVKDALDTAKQDFSNLVIWKTAEESAEKSNFARPTEVYQAFMAIAEVGEKYFDPKSKEDLKNGLKTAFKQRGFKYAHTESQTTRTMYKQQRYFSHNGQKKLMLTHLTLGGRDSTNCLQIYFDLNSETNKVDVGYCGVHLEYSSKRT